MPRVFDAGGFSLALPGIKYVQYSTTTVFASLIQNSIMGACIFFKLREGDIWFRKYKTKYNHTRFQNLLKVVAGLTNLGPVFRRDKSHSNCDRPCDHVSLVRKERRQSFDGKSFWLS